MGFHVGMVDKAYQWSPLEFFNSNATHQKYALLILNRPIRVQRDDMLSLWNRASLRVLVDGGTDCWFSFTGNHAEEDIVMPELITGDLDSATPAVVAHYQALGVQVVLTPDQNETDFTKALRQALKWLETNHVQVDAVIAVAETSGRFDQIIGNVNTLYKSEAILSGIPVHILSGNSLTWLLSSGLHHIEVGERLPQLGTWCSLMPVGTPAQHVTTTGLKWNLVDRGMKFGGMVSTSNSYSGQSFVTVHTDSSLIWSMSLGQGDDDA